MKALIQRVARAQVTVEGRLTGRIDRGMVVLLGVKTGDAEEEARFLAGRTAALRIFPDEAGKMNRSLVEIGGNVLVVSQFTLHADTRKGNRPSFIRAAAPEVAERLYGHYVDCLRRILGPDRVVTGLFRTSMQVELVNDGPVTLELNSHNE
ncbi:MAG: D-tyrosyl-tRNA(Tyr) deacylase [Lentisphaerae bacterium]|nr:D-tyrosyl-tRNA(Tyr) deacylase [Lentisphaerota bacterium]